MKTINKSVLIWYSPLEMYELVTAVADYPQFLPWCDHATVLSEHSHGMTAEIGIAMAGIRQKFTTQNLHVPGEKVTVKLINGPFSILEGQWVFLPVGDGSQRACKVAFQLHYGFDNAALEAVVGPVFGPIAGSLVDAFVKRAGQKYGGT